MAYESERQVAVEAVIKACRLCQIVRRSLVSAETIAKKDKSPVTVADFGGQAVVSAELTAAFPDIPMVGEEDAGHLRTEAGAELKAKVVQQVNAILPELSQEQVLAAIDYGTHEGGPTGRHWALDPIDGTKGFLRGDQYAIALGLIEDGQVVLGVLGCPNLPTDARQPDGPTGCVFVAVKGQGAIMRTLDDAAENRVHVTDIDDPAKASFCESVESGHSKHDDSARVAELLGVTAPPFRIDSQCKYAAIARGDSSIYLRMPTRADYEEKIWDHAAGWMVVTEAGGRVSDVAGRPLDFSIGRTLRNNQGVVATNGQLHDRVIAAVRQVRDNGTGPIS
jgi:3'(2'), 5'-bisphosphate nucleotidase